MALDRDDSGQVEDELIAQIVLRWADGLKQVDIARELGIGPVAVSRFLKQAMQEKKWIDLKRAIDRTKMSDRALAVIDGPSWDRLAKSLQELSPALMLRVTPTSNFNAFCSRAAEDVGRLIVDAIQRRMASEIKRPLTIGVTGGSTVTEVIAAMHVECGFNASHAPIVVPLCGEVMMEVHEPEVRQSASRIAAKLDRVISRSENPKSPTLLGVPAYIPRRFQSQGDSRGRQSVKGFYERAKGYCAIFRPRGAGSTPIADDLDIILTGCGIVTPAPDDDANRFGCYIGERHSQEENEITKEQLRSWIFGEIGGVILERPGLKLNSEDRRKLGALTNGWTGLTKRHLDQVAERARVDGGPGNIIVAQGPQKADCAIAAVMNGGFVTTLLIDESLAAAMAQSLGV